MGVRSFSIVFLASASLAACVSPLLPLAEPGQVVQQPAASAQGCREFTEPVTIGSQQQQAHGVACLQADGSWRIEQQIGDQPQQGYVVPPPAYQSYYPPDYPLDPWFYGPPLFSGGLFIGGRHFHHFHGFHGGPGFHGGGFHGGRH